MEKKKKKTSKESVTEWKQFIATQGTHIATSETGEATVTKSVKEIYMYIYGFAHP